MGIINYEHKTWYDKSDSRAIPINYQNLNRIDSGISDAVTEINKMNMHWWKKSNVVDGVVEYPSIRTDMRYWLSNSSSSTTTIYYSDSVSIVVDSSTGELSAKLDSPLPFTFSYDSLGGESAKNYTLEYKYFMFDSSEGGELYYATSYASGARDGSPYYYGIKIYGVYTPSLAKVYGNTEYISSPDRNAYPDGWSTDDVALYEYLGVPFENSRETGGILTGWYYGNDTEERAIDTGRKPKCIIVWNNADLFDALFCGIKTDTFETGKSITITDNGFTFGSELNYKANKYLYIVFY